MGIGFLICSLLLIAFPQPKLSKEGAEEMARSMGMIYRDEVKAMFDSSK